MSVLQRLVDRKRVAVTRTLAVTAVFHNGAVRKTITKSTTPTGIISPISSRISATSKVNIPPKYALSPNIALATKMSAEEVSLERIAFEIALQQDRGQGQGTLGGGQVQVHDGRVNMGGDQGRAQGMNFGGNRTAEKDRNAKEQKGQMRGGNKGNREENNDAPPWWQQ